VLQRVTVCCRHLHCVVVRYSTADSVQSADTCCSVFQCVAACCSVLSCVKALLIASEAHIPVAVRCSVLQCVAACFGMLRCEAVCYSCYSALRHG